MTAMNGWLARSLDRHRVAALFIEAVALALMALSFAAWDVRPEWSNSGGIVGATMGSAIGGVYRNRGLGPLRAVARGALYGLAILLWYIAVFGLAGLLSAAAKPLEPTAPSLFVGAFVLMGLGAVAWEPNPVRRLVAVLTFVALALVLGGILGMAVGGPWTALGPVAILGGLMAYVAAIAVSRRAKSAEERGRPTVSAPAPR